MEKICTKCKQSKLMTAFSIDKRLKNGRCSKCKSCSKSYYIENKDNFHKSDKLIYV